ncbi:DUF305 domain-containing protein [Nonomuraea sp. CA-218870]|uniref:DUF305 domain-containing protein n=1 Tax=Nonomuraea corallina TaxID=2989783 RepID=A0ABT4SGX9_9ACTN|nr:DUF305 domain-containing protein [Nonomuraea corallina]MDA0636473.1 DUF305 domain-containing protein [Nonomuraea corallina]
MRALWVTVLLTSAALAGCGDEPEQPSAIGTEAPVIVPEGPGATARTATPGERLGQVPPTPTAADVRFAEGMIPHHRQALEMAGLAAGRTTTASVLGFAQQIAISQQPEITIMSEWLTGLGRRVPSGHDHGGGMEGYGMATEDELKALRAAEAGAFDRMFLQLMIRHHEGALKMAEEALAGGKDQRMRLLARDVYAGQSIEIARMRKILDQLG